MKTLLLIATLITGVQLYAADTVYVSNVQQFLDSIRSNRVIFLEKGAYHLNQHTSLVDIGNYASTKELPVAEFVSYSAGDGVTIRGVQNLKIVGSSENPADIQIIGDILEDYVLNVYNSSKVIFDHLSFTHDETVHGNISGGLMKIQQSNTIKISECLMSGRASNGLFCWRSKEIEMRNTTIENCSYGIVDLRDSWSLKFNNCQFNDNKTCQTAWYMSGCVSVQITDCSFIGNHSRESHICERTKMFSFIRCEMLEFNNNIIKGNSFNFLGDEATNKIITPATDIKKNKFK